MWIQNTLFMTIKTIPFGQPILGAEEEQAVLSVLRSGILVHGPKAGEFESAFARYTGAKYAVSVSSCTAGLHLSYFVRGIGPGDEVIVPAQTHTATAHAVELAGATPIFVDADSATGNIDIAQIEQHITGRTKAISIVHFLGLPVDMPRILEIAQRRGLMVIEDCALAIGTRLGGAHAGTFGDVGCFSFYPVKHMTTTEGGMVTTNNPELAERIGRQKAFGLDSMVGERKIPGVYDVMSLGFNYRMSEMEAVIGIEQLKRIDGFLVKRKANYETLEHALQQIEGVELLQSTHDQFQSSYYCLSALLSKALIGKKWEIVDYLKQHGIGTSVYYPKPVPHMTYYKKKYSFADDSFPVAAWISTASIALPVGPHLNEEDMRTIAQTLQEAIHSVS